MNEELVVQPGDAIVIFRLDGSIELCLPEPASDPNSEVPLHVLAATEIMMTASEAGIEVLAEAFEERVKESH